MVGIRGVRNYPSDHLVLWDRIFFSLTQAGHQYDTGDVPGKEGMLNGDIEETGRYHTYEGVGVVRGTGYRVTRR